MRQSLIGRILVIGGLVGPGSPSSALDPNALRAVKLPAEEVSLEWLDASPSSYCIARDATAPPASPIGATTMLSFTDRPPAPAPIWYYGVEETASCPVAGCTAAATLGCGEQAAGNNAGPGSTASVSSYPDCGVSDATGREYVYQFFPAEDQQVTLALSGLSADLDLFVLEERGSGCDPAACIASDDDQASFAAVAGRSYYLVVDGRLGAVSDYVLQVGCAIDPVTCNPAGVLVCNSPAFGRTDDPGHTDALDAYACGGGDASGPEFTYSFTASGTGGVTFRLSGSTSAGVDLYVLGASACTGAGCIAFGDAEVTVPVSAGESYQVVVDGPAAAGYNLTAACDFPPGACNPVLPLRCGDVLFGDTRSGLATDVNDVYPCSAEDLSGRELTYEFAPPDRNDDYLVGVTVEPLGAELDVLVLRNQGAGCDPQGCLASGDREVAYDADRAGQYFLLVDGRNGAEGGFQILVDCISAPAPCSPVGPLACGDVLTGRSNGGPGSTDGIDGYPFCPPIVFDETGPETAYRFDSTRDQDVTVELTNLAGGTAHVVVLEDLGAGCEPASCVAKGTTRVTFAARAGATYYLITDGFRGDVATFDLSVRCI